jgi:hypothetical protein
LNGLGGLFEIIGQMQALLLSNPESVQECRITRSLFKGPVRGLRALEVSSGLSDKQCWETTASHDGGLSPFGLVRTIERGRSWDSEGREKGIYALAESPREDVTNIYSFKNPPTPLGDKTLKGLEDLEIHRDVFTGGFSDERVMVLSDPSLDLWRRSRTELGSEGWRIGMILGFQTVTLTAKAWTALAGDEKKAARLAKKLKDHAVLSKTGAARATVYTLDWSVPLEVIERSAEDDLRIRARALQVKHIGEYERIRRPASFEEIEVRRRARNTAQYAKPYFDAAMEEGISPELKADLEKMGHRIAGATETDWRRWMELDEVKEPGIIPDSPAALESVPRPAPVKKAAHALSPEQMAWVAEKRRQMAQSTR